VASPLDIVTSLWRDAGGPADALSSLSLGSAEPGLPSSFRVGAVAQATVAASALAAAQVHHDRGAPMQDVSVDIDHACAECRSEQFWRVDGKPTPELWDRIAGTYRCGDGRWVRIHTNFAHHRDGVLRLLGCAYDRAAVQAALSSWSADDFETQATSQDLVVAMMRSFDEWDAHPHAAAVRALPLWDAVRLDDAPALPWPPFDTDHDARPLTGPHARLRSLPPEGAHQRLRSGRAPLTGPHARLRSLPPEGAHQRLRSGRCRPPRRSTAGAAPSPSSHRHRATPARASRPGPRGCA
jgi:hypothetical protein